MVTIAIEATAARLGRHPVLEGIGATLTPGALVGIIGPNGAGKSTLLRAMLNLVPLSAGSIRIDGVNVAQVPRTTLARRLAYLPQGQTIHWPLSVERLVALGRLPHLAPMSGLGTADAAAVGQALDRADVADLRHRIVTELSGGERARVLLARALAVEAPGLIADEPLASLDPGHQIDVMTLLQDEARTGKLVVTVLHDLTMAARYCDRLLLLDHGRLVADGAPMTVLTEDHLASVYGIRARIDADLIDAGQPAPMIVPIGRCR